MKKEHKWNIIPIIGLETDDDLNKFSLEYLNRSEAHKGKFVSEETRKIFSKIHKGKIISDEQKQKLSEKLKGREFTIEHKNKIGTKHKNKIVSEETRKLISENSKKLRHSDETKELCRQAAIGINVGRKHTEEAKKKLSEAKKGKKMSDDAKKKMSDSQKKRTNHFNEEAIKNRKAKILKPIICYTFPNMEFVCEFESITDASIKLNRNKGGIGKILNGTIKEPRKYTFKYKN